MFNRINFLIIFTQFRFPAVSFPFFFLLISKDLLKKYLKGSYDYAKNNIVLCI